ncbi:MAG: RNA methyltransferase, partial [Gelidibacter sp.]
MLTKNQIKLIVSLREKKERLKQRLFVIEGKKTVDEFLRSHYKLHHLYALNDNFDCSPEKFSLVSEQELKKI